ncbi:MFS transporter [Nakamurella sp. YIM 132087]|uniref:MFS transporter n=1 Tax=Nakamurella alba TaxID=2665158 RepID=A0A7K1FEI3_9ACTN|nr:MFS transporter [Nakamurella alba]MTD12501.1 MFS transporter [Nakamurella alba]
MPTDVASAGRPARRTSPKRAATAAFFGSVIEYYDLVAYGTAAALVFGDLFFKGVTSHVALVLSFATFAAGYVARPLGGLLFGYIGDKIGRRTSVLLTIALMGGATVLMGLLPTYSSVGALAPILLVLLRICQGLAVGGELGGAVLISVEHAPAHRRGFFGSFSTAGAQAGTLLATAVFSLVTLMPSDDFSSWGWRLPFLGSAVIVLVGILIRYGLEETPDFEESKASGRVRAPLREAFTKHPGKIVAITLVMAGMMSIWYVITVYSLSYATGSAGIGKTSMLWIIAAANLAIVVMNPVWGALSDRVGRSKLITVGLLLEGALLFLYFTAVDSGSVGFVLVAMLLVAGVGHAMVNGIFPAFIAESLPTEVRYTAGSFGMQMAGLIAGFAPLVAVSLEKSPLGVFTIAIACFAFCLLGGAAASTVLRDRRRTGAPTEDPQSVLAG